MNWERLRYDVGYRQGHAFSLLGILALGLPFAALCVSVLVAMWLAMFGHPAHPAWTWINSYDKHGYSTGPSVGLIAYYFTLIQLLLFYEVCELLAGGFRMLRRAMT